MNLSVEDKLKKLQEIQEKQVSFCKWNQQNEEWQKQSSNFGAEPIQRDQITNITFNVLTDMFGTKPFRTHVICSEERYASTLKDIGEIQPDIISFNEVSTTFNKMIRECSWIRANYWVNEYFYESVKGFSNILLTKMKPLFYDKIMVNELKRPIEIAFFHIKNSKNQERIVSFTSIHLSHVFELYKVRFQELTHLKKQLQKYQGLVDSFILQGDMNFHSEKQNEILPKLQLKDAWLSKYNIEDHPGYTLDTDYNEMTYELSWGFREGRMRLDRIFMTGDAIDVKDINIIFDNAINGQKKQTKKKGYIKGGVSFVSDMVFGKNLFRQKESYFYKSDHFGLSSTFIVK